MTNCEPKLYLTELVASDSRNLITSFKVAAYEETGCIVCPALIRTSIHANQVHQLRLIGLSSHLRLLDIKADGAVLVMLSPTPTIITSLLAEPSLHFITYEYSIFHHE